MIAMQLAVARLDRRSLDRVVGFLRAPGMDVFRAGGGAHAAWMEVRGWSLADAIERHYDQRALESAGVVVVNSEMAARDVATRCRIAPDRLRLVRNGVDLERFRPSPVGGAAGAGGGSVREGPGEGRGARRRVTFLGSGFARKGLAVAIRAVAALPGVALDVLGADRHQGRFAALASRLGIDARVRFLGAVEAPERLLPVSDAFILPTRYDPFANACLEALACGVPVITSRRNGAAEVCPYPWMSVEDPEDVAGFARALGTALDTAGLRDDCRAAAERWPHSLSFAHMAAVIEAERAVERPR
jgi:UDP-glucose:(heptosyl)LPS alpha-1,3-glucosyltransferase